VIADEIIGFLVAGLIVAALVKPCSDADSNNEGSMRVAQAPSLAKCLTTREGASLL